MAKNSFQTVSTGVFDRDGHDEISANVFYFIMSIVLAWGLGATAYFANYAIEIGFMPNIWIMLLIGLAIPILGIVIAVKSNNPLVSFIGYNMVVIPFGFLLGPAVNQYSPDVVKNAMTMTAGIAIFMGLMGTMFPNFFSKIGGFLFVALFGLLLVMILQLFIPALRLGVIDYIGAGIFSLYIGFDMYRANHMPKTVDNAVDICVDLYLDIINLFLFILKIMGKK
jgi:FtsH-binding integral membrane protein